MLINTFHNELQRDFELLALNSYWIRQKCFSHTGVVLQRIILTKERQTMRRITESNARQEKESSAFFETFARHALSDKLTPVA